MESYAKRESMAERAPRALETLEASLDATTGKLVSTVERLRAQASHMGATADRLRGEGSVTSIGGQASAPKRVGEGTDRPAHQSGSLPSLHQAAGRYEQAVHDLQEAVSEVERQHGRIEDI